MVWGNTGTHLNAIYTKLDPRFGQTVGYNGCTWNNTAGKLETFLPDGKHKSNCNTGYHFKKFIPDVQTGCAYTNSYPSWPVFRLAEFYLIYAGFPVVLGMEMQFVFQVPENLSCKMKNVVA